MPKYSSGPLKGQRNRLSDLNCAWKKAHPSERAAFLDGLRAEAIAKVEPAPTPAPAPKVA